MKIRIRGNSLRFRLTKPEVETLCTKGVVAESAEIGSSKLNYLVKLSSKHDQLHAAFDANTITLFAPASQLESWNLNEVVGFEYTMPLDSREGLDLLLEKDFTCLTPRAEDESDNYPNPKGEMK